MTMNSTPSGERVHIGLFGRRNAGKSSVINALTGQQTSVVSDVSGTTTDPVYKAMELLPVGPVVLIDTPGYDDEGALGQMRVKRTRQVLEKTDVAVLVMDAALGKTDVDAELCQMFLERGVPFVEVYNKSELAQRVPLPANALAVSAHTGEGIGALKERIAALAAREDDAPPLVADLVSAGDVAVLVTPIDSAAPKGRLILPQQQVIRGLLDAGAIAVVAKDSEYAAALHCLAKRPALVVTDSQVFAEVAAATPPDVPLTSFSILMARRKGLLDAAVEGVAAIDALADGDEVLICEGCTHHRQCDDIGTVKIPRWLKEFIGKELALSFCSGADFPDDLSRYALIIHCGGCMLNDRAVRHRVSRARRQGVPITNYGIVIARMKGILARSIEALPDISS